MKYLLLLLLLTSCTHKRFCQVEILPGFKHYGWCYEENGKPVFKSLGYHINKV